MGRFFFLWSILSLVFLPSVARSQLCRQLFGWETGYSPALVGLSPQAPHTIRNIPRYLEENLGAQGLEMIRRGEDFFMLEGDGFEKLAELKRNGWILKEQIQKKAGFHIILILERGLEKRNFVLRVNGTDRKIHIESLFKLAGLPSSRFHVQDGLHRWKENYLRTFRSLGSPPDFVIYGLSYQVAKTLLRNTPLKPGDFLKVSPPALSEPDVNGRSLKVIELNDGRKIWIMPPLYGDLAGEFFESLFEFGAKNVVFLGTAGAVQPNFRVGDWVTPIDSGLTPSKIFSRMARYQRVSSANLESKEWLSEMTEANVDFVEVELGYVLASHKKFENVQLRVGLVISDVLQGPNHQDYSEIRVGEIPGLEETVAKFLSQDLNLSVDDSVQATKAFSHPFSTQGSAPDLLKSKGPGPTPP